MELLAIFVLNNFMKRYSLCLLLIVFLTPSIAFASWWNPFSWFKKQVVQPPVVQVSVPTTNSVNDKKVEKEKVVLKKEKQDTKSTSKQITPTKPTTLTTPSSSAGGGASPGVMVGPCPIVGPCTAPPVIIDNSTSSQVLPVNAGCDSGNKFSSITGKSCNDTILVIPSITPITPPAIITRKRQTPTPTPTPPLTYKELHCPKITMIKDSLGNVGNYPFQGFGIRGGFAKGTVNSITLEITATDPQGLPVYFTHDTPADWSSESGWKVFSLENTFTLDVSNSSTGVHIVTIGIDNQDDFNCVQPGDVDARRQLEYSVYLIP